MHARTTVTALLLACASSAAFGAPLHDPSHDFDFEFGRWKTHVKRLVAPLTGSSTWVEMNGTTVVTPVLGGRANLVELEAEGPKGPFRGMSLRLYDPQARSWSLHFANAADGQLATPTVGRFTDGRGEFFSDEMLEGKPIRVRFVISDITPTSCRFEQAFSADGGRTWETNWIATDTRIGERPARMDR